MRLAVTLAPLFRTEGLPSTSSHFPNHAQVFGRGHPTSRFALSFGEMSDNSAETSSSPAGPSQSQAELLAVADPQIPELTYETWAGQTKALVESIYDGISAPFCCGGTIQHPRPVQVTTIQDNVTYTIQPPPSQFPGSDVDVDAAERMVHMQEELLREFVEKAPPAVFGKGTEEMFDTKVRNGKQLPAESFATNIEPDMLRNVLRQIQADLGLRVGIEAEPYSINIYEEGGLFESHKDTPRGRGMFGTMVLCLPSLFLGGALQVGMTQGTTQSFFGKHLDHCTIPFQENLSGDPSWWRSNSNEGQANGGSPIAIPWCAFFSDADHRVSPVRRGVRVALSYLLRRTDGVSSSSTGLVTPRALGKADERAGALVEAFESIKSNPFQRKVRVAVPCDHLYTTSEVWPYSREEYGYSYDTEEGEAKNWNRLTPDTVGRLKGRDALVAIAANAAGLQVFLMPYLNTKNGEDADPYDTGDIFIKDFEADFYPQIRLDNYIPPPVEFAPEDCADIWIKDYHSGAAKRKGAVGYFGNGAADIEEYYLRAALLVEPYPPRKFRFTMGKLSEDVPVDFDKDRTMRGVLDEALRNNNKEEEGGGGGGLFSDPRLAAALADSSSRSGNDAGTPPPVAIGSSLTFVLTRALWDPDMKSRKSSGTKNSPSVTFGRDEFLRMLPAHVAGRVEPWRDPVVIELRVAKRGVESDGEEEESMSRQHSDEERAT